MYFEKVYLHESQGRKDVTLTCYVLDKSPEIPGSSIRPAVLICPGGAYLGCSDREGEPVAMAFAAMGYHTFVLRYSTYNEGKGMSPVEVKDVKPHCVHPGPMKDIGAAMLFIKNHAAEWNLDAEKIAICGFSAGGHNCAMYSVYWDKPVLSEYAVRPAAAILGYPLTDYLGLAEMVFEREKQENTEERSSGLFTQVSLAFLGTKNPSPQQLLEVSPPRLVDANTPPTFIWFTAEDETVPVQQAYAMANGLANNNIPHELHVFEKGLHGMSLATAASAGGPQLINQDAAQWMPLCGAWLAKHFAM